jgi:hypothetical protein
MPSSSLAAVPALKVPFSAVRAGYKISFSVSVEGKDVVSRGEVFSVRRVSNNKMEITLLHAKTGALFTNVVKGNAVVMIHSEVFTFEPTDALGTFLMAQLTEKIKQDAMDFYTLPIED